EQTQGCVKVSAVVPGDESSKRDKKTPLSSWPAEVRHAFLQHMIAELRRCLEAAEDESVKEPILSLAGYLPCPDCQGARLNREALWVRFGGKALHEVTALTVDEATAFFEKVVAEPGEESGPAESRIRTLVGNEVLHRLRFLQEVGLGYLTLDRPAPTLSGGESQRARLATYLGAGLLGVCYILDEPTIGLHPRDTARLLAALRGLQAGCNTLVVL